jgi:hypothetical protein
MSQSPHQSAKVRTKTQYDEITPAAEGIEQPKVFSPKGSGGGLGFKSLT